jgi:hypothetical protein
MNWATRWALFSQTHLVTLARTKEEKETENRIS